MKITMKITAIAAAMIMSMGLTSIAVATTPTDTVTPTAATPTDIAAPTNLTPQQAELYQEQIAYTNTDQDNLHAEVEAALKAPSS